MTPGLRGECDFITIEFTTFDDSPTWRKQY